MPRRMIDPRIWLNERFGKLSDPARLLFIGIFSNADDDGRIKGSPSYLKALIFPYDNDKTSDEVKQWRDLCVQSGLARVYNRNGCEYIDLPGWGEHQWIRKDTYRPSTLPSFEDVTMPLQVRDEDVTDPSQDRNTPVTVRHPSIVQYSIDKYSIDKGGALKKYPPEFISFRKTIFEKLKERRGYTSRQPAAEAQAISQMLAEKLSVDDILKGYDLIKAQPFYQDKNLSMMQVRKNIHEVLKYDTGTNQQRLGKIPTHYTDPESLRHDIERTQ
jgi:hypothetical protein